MPLLIIFVLFRVGYHESLTETMHFLVEKEGLYAGDPTCIRLINHLQKHFETLSKNNGSFSFYNYNNMVAVIIFWLRN